MSDELSGRSAGAALWAGRVLTGLVALFLIMDGGIKLVPLAVVTETMTAMGWPGDAGTARMLGVLLLAATALYLWPRTSLLGTVLLTGYLGGAIATHLRIGSPLATHTLFGVYVGVAAWAGLWLRDLRVRSMLPLRH